MLFGVDLSEIRNPSSSHNKDEIERKKKKITRKNCNLEPPPPPPLFHPTILEEGDGPPPVFLFEKELTPSDVAKGLNRLIINDPDKLLEFLREEEKRKVQDKLDVLAVVTKEAQLGGNQRTLHLTKWNMSNLNTIVLKHDWRKFVDDNGLQHGDLVHGWGYRRAHEFRLALNIIRH
ncbi:hypothetical protein ACS0TY_002984 [Phlomoides rotata]